MRTRRRGARAALHNGGKCPRVVLPAQRAGRGGIDRNDAGERQLSMVSVSKAVIPLSADVVEKVRWWERQTSRRGTAGRCRGSGWHGVHGEWNKLGELAEVLGCSGEVELVTGAVRPA